MIPIKKETNYMIDWKSHGDTFALEKTVYENRKHYFQMLRNLLTDLDGLEIAEVSAILNKHNVYFVEIDDFPRVNLDEPN